MRWLTAALLLAAAVPAPAGAQGPPADRPVRRLEVAFGAGLLGPGDLGGRTANLRANSSRPEPFRLFDTDTRFAAAPALEARAGISLTRRYGLEGGISFTRPELRSSLTDDAEDGPHLTLVERVDQYLFDGGVVIALEELPLGPVLPVASGGIGYLRQLHEGRLVVEHGVFLYGGFGVRHWLRTGGQGIVKATGLRGDARLHVVNGGIDVGGGLRVQGGLSAALFVVF